MRLAAATTQGGTLVVWLTQRLLRRILPYMLEWLDQRAGSLPRRELTHDFAQEAARAALAPQPGVEASAADQEWIAIAADIGREPDGLTVNFRNSAGHAFLVRMSEIELRQWLSVVHALWQHAEWPMDVWPNWIAAQTSVSPGHTSLH